MLPRLLGAASALFTLLANFVSTPGLATADVQKALALNKEGERLIEQGKYVDAVAIFSKMLGECGPNKFCTGVAKFFLGRSHLEIAQYETAMSLLDEAEQIFASLNQSDRRGMVLINRAKVMVGRADYRSALKELREAEKIFSENKNQKELFQIYSSLAVVHSYTSDYDAALECLNKAEALIRDLDDPKLLGPLNNNKGLVLSKRQSYADAMSFYEQALKYHQSCGDLKGKSVVLNNIGNVHESRSEYAQALKKYQESLKLARQIQDPWCESLALNNIGCVELRRGGYLAAQEAHEKALEIRRKFGAKHFAAETLSNLGLVWLAYADYPRAAECFQDCNTICKEVGSISCEAWASHNRAFLLKDQGKFKEALAASDEAVTIAKNIGDRRLESTAILRLGNLYEYQGMFEKAFEEYVKAAEIQKEIQDWNFRSNTLSDMANILVRKGEVAEAEVFYTEALRLKEKIGATTADLLCRYALFQMEKHNYAKVSGSRAPDREEDLSKANALIQAAEETIKPEHRNDLMLLTYVKGKFLLEKDPQESIKLFTSMKSQAEGAGARKFSFLAAVGLGLAHEALNDWQKAQDAFSEAVDYAEAIRKTLDPESRLTFLEGEEILGVKHLVPYEGLSRVLMRKGEKEASFAWADYTKARSFSEALSRKLDDTSFKIPKDVLDRDMFLENKLAALMTGLDKAREQGAEEAVADFRKEIEELSSASRQHQKLLKQDFPLFSATKYPEPQPLAQAALAESEWVLAYDVTDPGLLIYLLKGRTVVKGLYKPIPRREVDELVRSFRAPLDIVPGKDDPLVKLRSFDFESGGKLTRLLLSDVLDEIPMGQHLMIVPDASLGILPFEMLTLNDSGKIVLTGEFPVTVDAEFLGDRNPVSYYQSVTALTLARNLGQTRKATERLLVIADPVFELLDARAEPVKETRLASAERDFGFAIMKAVEAATGGELQFNRLPLTGDLARGLSELFEGNSDLYLGLQANKQGFLKGLGPNLGQYDRIVFGTHGLISRDSPYFKEPILVLTLVPVGTDGFLRMSEVMGLNVNSDIVALTACQTGLGVHVSGEGTMGMGRAFQYAGARSVLMSLWSVSETASVRLVETLFKQLKGGKPKLEALQAARREIREAGFDHPFFWAAFILVGEVN